MNSWKNSRCLDYVRKVCLNPQLFSSCQSIIVITQQDGSRPQYLEVNSLRLPGLHFFWGLDGAWWSHILALKGLPTLRHVTFLYEASWKNRLSFSNTCGLKIRTANAFTYVQHRRNFWKNGVWDHLDIIVANKGVKSRV